MAVWILDLMRYVLMGVLGLFLLTLIRLATREKE